MEPDGGDWFVAGENGSLELRAPTLAPSFGRAAILRFGYDGPETELGLHFDFGPGLAPLPGFPISVAPGEQTVAFEVPKGVHQLVLMPDSGARISVRDACLVAAGGRRKKRPVERALATLDHSGGLVPVSSFAYDEVTRTFRSVGPDPQMRMVEPPLHSGFYMWELRESFEGPRSVARLYARYGREFDETDAIVLPLRPDQLTKRIVRLTDRPKAMRFDPVEHSTPIAIERLALLPVTDRFALERMLVKLGRGDVPRARRDLAAGARERGVSELDLAYERYDGLFAARASSMIRYADWIANVEPASRPDAESVLATLSGERESTIISVIVPVFDPAEAHLRACLDSVLAQRYPHWELCVADDASTVPHVRRVLDEYAARDARIRLVFRTANGRIAAATESALALATGAFVAFLDHDDTLDPDALTFVVDALRAHPDAAIVYTDEDKLDRDGLRSEPHFKPDWNRDLLYGLNYVSHLGVYRRSLVEAVGGIRAGFDGSQDYDLLLRCIERSRDDQIVHVPHILYHWRMSERSVASGDSAKDYTTAASIRALEAHFAARGESVRVSSHRPNFFRAHFPVPTPAPLVSIIVPTRDGGDVLRRAIESIRSKTDYPAYELIVVDNQSVDPKTLSYFRELEADPRVHVIAYDAPFNFSAINNFAVERARGELVALVNDDVEVISPSWLDEMVSLALRPGTGCVGAKLYYANDTIQHAGVILGLGGVAGHSHKHVPRASPGYFGRLVVTQELSAVTAACLVVRASIYREVGGLDAQGLPIAFNDVDFCLRVKSAGYRNVWTPFAELYHHESVSRGRDDAPEKRDRFAREIDVMKTRWRSVLDEDPAYSVHLTQDREDFTITTRVRGRITGG